MGVEVVVVIIKQVREVKGVVVKGRMEALRFLLHLAMGWIIQGVGVGVVAKDIPGVVMVARESS
jgi:hypothetical protein